MRTLRLGLPLWALSCAMLLNCSGDEAPARGQVMLALRTDMALPKDISRIKLQVVSSDGRVQFDKEFTVGADGEAKIPATFAIVAPEGQAPSVEVRVIGFNAKGPRTFNKAITTVPRDRIAVLQMPIQWLCDKSVVEIGADNFASTCERIGDDEEEAACVAGICQKVSIREDQLPDFSPPNVFGGGEGPDDSNGKCFDTVSCFNLGLTVRPDANCRVSLTASPTRALNFALRPSAKGEGICGTAGDCYVPLDESEVFGWTELSAGSGPGAGGAGNAGGESGVGGGAGDGSLPDFGGSGARLRTFQLPPAVCQKLTEKVVASVYATAACETKTERLPVCGDWYSKQAQPVMPMQSGGAPNTATCPEFKPGSPVGSPTGAPLFDGMMQVAADLRAEIDRVASATFASCAGIIDALGGDAPAPPVTLTAAALKSACDGASSALEAASDAASGSNWSVLLAASQCHVSFNQQTTCESTCSRKDCSGERPEPAARCSDLGGSCTNRCTGSCSGTEATPTTCNGTCQGVCEGSCDATCIREDGSADEDACAGWCTGVCDGTCSGSCVVDSEPCESTCWVEGGRCTGSIENVLCAEPIARENCLGTCGTLCAAEATLGHGCDSGSAKLYGDAPDALRAAIDAHYASFTNTLARSALLTAASNYVQELYATFVMEEDGRDPHATACLAAVANATGSGIGLVTAALDGTVNVVSAVSAGQGATACTPASGDDPCVSCLKGSCCSEAMGCVTPAACESCALENCSSECGLDCTGTDTYCSGTCVDLQSNVFNCGGCGEACATGQICVNSGCVCPGEFELCAGSCVDTRNSATNCGGCGNVCGAGRACSSGTCVSTSGQGGSGGNMATAGATSVAGSGNSAGQSGGGVSGGGSGGRGGDALECPSTMPAARSDCSNFQGSEACVYGDMYCTCSCVDGCRWACGLG